VRSTSDDPALDSHGDLIALDHLFSFDDPASGDWTRGAGARMGTPKSRNVESSFVAGHVYESPTLDEDCGDGPGTCDKRSPQLDVQGTTEIGNALATDLVQIKDWKLLWDPAAHQVLCINPTGNTDFTACPSVDPVDHVEIGISVGADDLDDALVTFGCVDQTMRCLLKAGGSYVVSDTIQFRDDAARVIGRYGEGVDPIVSCAGIPAPGYCFGLVADVSRLTLMDLDIHGSDEERLVMVINSGAPSATNVLMLRIDGRGFNNCFHFHTGNLPVFADLSQHKSMVWIVDSSCLGGPGLGGLDVFIAAGNSGLLGNAFGDRGAAPNDEEHNVRFKRWYRSIAAHNSIGLLNDSPAYDGCGDSRHPLTLRSGFSHYASVSEDPEWAATNPRDFDSKEFVLADNEIRACRRNSNQFQVSTTDSSKCGSSLQDYVADGNFCWNGYNEISSPKCFLFTGHWFRVSNNVAMFTADGGGASSQPRGIQIQDRRTGSDGRCDSDLQTTECVQEDLDAQPTPGSFLSNATVTNNSVYFHSKIGAQNGLAYCIDADAHTVSFRDNVSFDGGGMQGLLENLGVAVTGCDDGLPGTCNFVTATVCDNGIDDDGDGRIDDLDPGCADWLDSDEKSLVLPCDNGVDDDGDLLVDMDDPGCASPGWATESPACNDGIDNDNDGEIDLDDSGCVASPWHSEVRRRSCGLGFELAPILGLLYWVASRRRQPAQDHRTSLPRSS